MTSNEYTSRQDEPERCSNATPCATIYPWGRCRYVSGNELSNSPELGVVAKRVRERTGRTIRDWSAEHRIGTTVVSEFERLGKIPATKRIRRALEHAYNLPVDALDRIAEGAEVEATLAVGSLDDRLPHLVQQLKELVEELARTVGNG